MIVYKFPWYRPRNLVDVLKKRARKVPDQIAYLFLEDGEEESGRITYGELDKKARVIAAYLQNKQLIGQPVILLYPTGLDFIAAFMGCLYAGCIAVPASCPALGEFKKSASTLLTLAQNSGALTVLTLPAYIPLLKEHCAEFIATNNILIAETKNLNENLLAYYKPVKIDEKSITHLQYTSGSTSAPKGVITCHKNLISSLKNHIRSWGYDEQSVTLSWTPHSHVYGLLGGLLVPLYNGSLGILLPPAEFIRKPANWLRAISKYHVSHSGGPNFSYELCAQRIRPEELNGIDLSSWKVAPAAGEPVRYLTLEKFIKSFGAYGFHIQNFCSSYGMSEATGLIAASKPGHHFSMARMERLGLLHNNVVEVEESSNTRAIISSGLNVFGLEVTVVNPDSLTLLSEGVIGEIWLSGETICSGYWGQSEETQKVFKNQLSGSNKYYLRTGDLGYLKEGEIYLTGRLKEVIIIYGKKYYPQDIEAIASEMNAEIINSCENIVFSIEKEGKEKVIIVQEITHDIDSVSKDELISSIRQAISEQLKIDLYGICLVEKNSLPRTPSGKLSRKLSQAYFLEDKFNFLALYLKEDKLNQSPAVAKEPQSEQIVPRLHDTSLLSLHDYFSEDLMNIISTELNIKRDEINSNDNLSKYGFDSINIANMVSNLNDTFGLTLTPAHLFEYKTVNDIVIDLVEKNTQLFVNYYQEKIPISTLVADDSITQSDVIEDSHNQTPTNSTISDRADIAIIGMHGVFPGSPDLETFWNNLIEGKDLISEVPPSRWNWHDYYDGKDSKTKAQWGGFIDGVDQFDARFFSISPIEAELMDPQQRIFLEVAWKTIEDSGCNLEELAKSKTGLFVGVSSSDYREHLHQNNEMSPYLITGVYHSLLPNRISYLLNLSGTSEVIDTACSSSLVAIHHAVQAIQQGDCDLAIAGGVNINLFPDLFLTFNKAGMLSEDGRCKTFDASANGYVRGEGAGAILLKPLAQARADGDIIYAIIKGSATNHGGHVNSLTVPNPNAQAAVIVEACERAKIDIESINYIEAHGTGTPIGDPIEINGLKKAFQTLYKKQKKLNHQTNYCGVGSVKTNIGHLEPAAGIAGVIKVLLAMQHGQIPGTLHFKELNPFIEIKDSPFYIMDKSSEWIPVNDQAGTALPRRAGISSFGIGGSNAHIILEEVRVDVDALSKPCKSAYLITLSAKTLTALKQKLVDLECWLNKKNQLKVNENSNIENISYTLNQGRNHFDYRYAFVVSSIQELYDKIVVLNQNQAFENIEKHAESNNQQKEVIRSLFEDIASYKTLSPDVYKNKLILLADLYTHGCILDWDKLHRGESNRKISLPTYPFDKQRYWLEEQKEKINVGTKELLPALLHSLLDYNVSFFNKQRFTKKFTGSEFYLVDHRINQTPTLPGAVYLEMTRAAAELSVPGQNIKSIANVFYIAPFQPSILTNEITVNLAQNGSDLTFEITSLNDSAVQVSHVQGKISVGPAVQSQAILKLDIQSIKERCRNTRTSDEVYEQFSKDGLQYGPSFQVIKEINSADNESIALLKLPEHLAESSSQFVLHPSLLDGAFQAISGLKISNQAGNKLLYLPFSIEKIDIYAAIPQDCYVYVKRAISNKETMPKFHIDIVDEKGTLFIHINNFTLRALKKEESVTDSKQAAKNTYYYKPVWLENILDGANKGAQALMTKPILVFAEDNQIVLLLKQKFPQLKVFHASSGASYESNNDDFKINMHRLEDYMQLFNDLQERDFFPEYIIYPMHSSSNFSLSDTQIKQQLDRGLHAFFYLSQALVHQKLRTKVKLMVLNEKQEGIPALFVDAFSGFAKTLHIEQPMIIPRMIYIEDTGKAKPEYLFDEMLQTEDEVLYDKNHTRWIKSYEETDDNKEVNNAILLKKAGVYIITGGMGGLGLLFAKFLAQSYQANVILLGRSALNESQQIMLAELEQSGGQVIYLQADITNQELLAQALQTIKSRFGVINGIIHSAGVIHDNFLLKKTLPEIDAVIAPKIYGTLYLDALTQAEPLDFFVLFSSIASILGNTGQSDYAYANRFIDNFAQYREQLRKNHLRQGSSISLNWPLWAEGRMQMDTATKDWLKQTMGMELLTTADGIAAFLAALAQKLPQSIILAGEKEKLEQALHIQAPDLSHPIAANDVTESPIRPMDNTELQQKTENYLKDLLSSVSKISRDELESSEHFEKYGIDSLMIVSLNQQLEQSFKDLPKTLFFEYTTLEALTKYFIENHAPLLIKKFAIKATPVNDPVQDKAAFQRPVHQELPSHQSVHSRDIAIIGLSGQYPMADDLDAFWENIKAGKDCITEIPQERWDYHIDYDPDKNKEGKSYSKWGGFISDVDKFDALFFNISPHEACLLDPQERLFLQTAWQAIEDAGYSKESLSEQQIGVFVGVMYGHYQLFGEDESLRGHPMATLSSYASIANRVSYFLNLHGPSIALDTMCSSSITSIHLACQSILNGECQMALAGGVNVSIHPNKYIALSQGKFVSGDGRCRSFGEGGDGYVPGEGVGVVLLKSLEHALNDNDQIYGVIKGSSLNHGGKTNSYTVPSPTAQTAVIHAAFLNAAVDPAEISYLEAHGTGTSLGDPIEIAGLSKVFGFQQRDTPCPIGSVKSNIGHCESAAGIASLTKVLLQMRHKLLVPSIHSETLNLNINWAATPFKVQHELGDWTRLLIDEEGQRKEIPRRAGISSFGAGGANAHIIIEEAPERNLSMRPPLKPYYLVTLSGKTDAALKNQIINLASWLENQTQEPALLEDISYALNHGRSHFEKRGALVVSSLAELHETLESLKNDKLASNAAINLAGKDKSQNQAIFKKLFAQLMREISDINQISSDEYRDSLQALANFYVNGSNLDWKILHANEAMRKISLPAYPFDKERYWVKTSELPSNIPELNLSAAERTEPLITEEQSSMLSHEASDESAISGQQINESELRLKTEALLKNLVAKVISLPPDRIKSSETFENYGIDSVMIVKLNQLLEEIFGDLSKTLFFEYGTTADLAQYFIENHAEFLIKKLAIKANNTHEVTEVKIPSIPQPPLHASPTKMDVDKSLQNAIPKNLADIAIIGISGRFPQAENLDEFWENLKIGKDSISEIPNDRWDYHTDYDPDKNKKGKTYSKWGGFITDIDKFDPLFFNISPKEAELLDPQERLFLETAWQTVEDSGYTVEKLSDKKIGVFVGAMYGEYQLYGAQESIKGHITALSSSHASIANRVSYYLNFHGPSIALDTMCSSSLTAIHLACKSIRDNECQLALAGGVNLSVHPNKYILLSQGKFLASDGHCHSFGEGGDGYVPGEGVGALLLKPLEHALADGDHVYGVIKGSSINHGGRTNGYTVPNPTAQAALIEENFKNTGINPATISYIEAHGTGTSLGDPIEINGLSKVFGHEKRENPIAIGSVKSNIGHLESAAGMAAIAKVLLQMQHKAIVPSIYSQQLNSNINWEKMPFKVQHELSDWKRPVLSEDGIQQEIPRRAGISSFGAGGANANLIIEEAPDRVITQSVKKPAYLLGLSAKTQASLKQRMSDITQWLNQHEDVSLEALSQTLNMGRSHFDKRSVLVAASIDELKEMLFDIQAGKEVSCYFQGDASKKPEDSAIYEQVLSTTLDELKLPLDDNKYKKKLEALASLYAKGYELDWALLHQGETFRKISLPTYPFAKERYWIPDGVSDNFKTITRSGSSLHPLIDINTSTLETECFNKLFTGKEFYLTDHYVEGNSVLPGAAYLEMARAAGELAAPTQRVIGLHNILFAKPILISGSACHATISIYPEESGVNFEVTTSGTESTVHAQGKIIFASQDSRAEPVDIEIQKLQESCTRKQLPTEIYSNFDQYGLHYGPSFQVIQYLMSNDSQAIAKIQLPDDLNKDANQFILHPSILDGAFQAICGLKPNDSSEDNALYLPFSIDEVNLFGALPPVCYAYVTRVSAANAELSKFQIQITNEAGKVLVQMNNFTVRLIQKKAIEKAKLSYYSPVWEEQALVNEPIIGPVLVFDNEGSVVQAIREQLPTQTIIRVVLGDEYKSISKQEYQLNSNISDHYLQLFNELKEHNLAPNYIIYRTGLSNSTKMIGSVIDAQLQQGFYPLFYITQALIKQKPKQNIRVLSVNEIDDGMPSPFAAAISGFAKTVVLEHPKLIYGVIDIVAVSQQGINALLQELNTQEVYTRYDHKNVRWVEGYEQTDPSLESLSNSTALLKKGNVYLITGGLGGLGLIFANYLAEHYQAKLVLMGRSELKEKQQAVIDELEQKGAQVLYVQADVAQPNELEMVMKTVKSRFGAINGIIHSAGVLRDAFILKKTSQKIAEVFAPKINGTIYLDELTQSESLDFFMMFSSIASVFGNPGQCDYAYANRFIDQFTELREAMREQNQRHGKTVVINWPLWEEGGMQIDDASKQAMERNFGLSLLPTAQGLIAFHYALTQKNSRQIVLYSNVVDE